jgi:tetratricopeptide (TPR) repeat protein
MPERNPERMSKPLSSLRFRPAYLRGLAVLSCGVLSACAAAGAPDELAEDRSAALPVPRVSDPRTQAIAYVMQAESLRLEGRLLDAAQLLERAAQLDPESVDLQRKLGQMWARMGKPERAVAYARRAFELDRENEDVRRELALILIAGEQYEDAAKLLEERLNAGKLSEDGIAGLFNLYLELGRLDDARRIAELLIESAPESLRGHLALGHIHELESRFDDAEAAYRHALEVAPTNGRIYDSLAQLARKRNDTKGEMEVLREKLEVLPDDRAALMRKAELLDESGDRSGAIATLEQLVAEHPDDIGAEFQLGAFYLQAGKDADAVKQFESIASGVEASRSPELFAEVQFFLGRAYSELGRSDDARSALTSIPPDSPRFADARVALAQLYEGEERHAEALSELRLAVRAVPEDERLQVYQARLMQRTGDLTGAVGLMEKLIEADPTATDLYYDLGVIYGDAGQEDRAVELMLQVLEKKDDHASALNYVGYTWADRGTRLTEAEDMIRRAAALQPKDGFIVDSLGWVLYKQGLELREQGKESDARANFDLAVSELQRALELLEPDDPIITRHLGDVYRTLSRYSDALDAYRRALVLDPSKEESARIQREIDLLESELKAAKPKPGATR